ncbi:MAG: enoyl-CoA hydratase/isomerase family protein [Rhodospirillaceae bacterium]|nr:enoyl-CoA hydratase/isomerase family protein [Rhodospirillales bacterium]
MSENSLRITVTGTVATVTLTRPQVHNALDELLMGNLAQAFQKLAVAEAVRVIVLEAEGKSFCAGADVNWMRRAADLNREDNQRDAMLLAVMIDSIERCPKPVIAVVQGAALGGGVGLVAACDMVIAAEEASFALTEVRLGLEPSVIGPVCIAAMGARACRRYFLTGERFDAAEAWRLGLVHELASDDADLDEKVGDIVDAMLACGPVAQREAKELIRAVCARPVTSEVIEDTAERIARIRSSPEGREGVGAFLEKRRPAWIAPEPETMPEPEPPPV